MGLAMLVAFLSLMVLGMPIAFALGLVGTLGLLFLPGGAELLPIVPQELYRSLDSFPLLTIPLFIFAGGIMAQGGVATRLMALAEATVGRGRGGLGSAVVVATMLISGISGSSTADTAAVGRVALPMLRQQRYPVPFSTALIGAAGAAALLIPPTIDLIIIGIVANMSIAALFAAGIIPALINGLGLIAVVLFVSRRRHYGGVPHAASVRQVVRAFVVAIPALLMIVLILGGILSGIFTATEASAVAVAYGLVVSLFVYRDLKPSMLPGLIRSTVEISGLVVLMIAMGGVFSYVMTMGRIPGTVAAWLVAWAHSPVVFLILVQILFFFLGMIMDGTPALLILMPILTPIAMRFGIAPIHFGILVEANVAIGMITPPVGLCLYTACGIANIPIERVVKPLIPMIAILTMTMLTITYVPGFSLFLPRLLGLLD
jgi:C4-dicarboxylate transporter DctM subunit